MSVNPQSAAAEKARAAVEVPRRAVARSSSIAIAIREKKAMKTLMRLCVYRNSLPQGAPTSPCLSNLVNFSLDERLWRLAQRTGATYTRYGDDLAFSWNCDRMPGGFQRAVEDALHAAGYEVQPRKGWHVSSISDRPRVTGLVLIGAGRVSIPWALRWRTWCLRCKACWSADNDLLAKLQGYKGYVRMVMK